jgi:integrase/recombinase XerD
VPLAPSVAEGSEAEVLAPSGVEVEVMIMEKLLYEYLEYGRRRKLTKVTIDEYRRTVGEFVKFLRDNYPDIKDIADITRDVIISYEKHLMVKKDARGKTMTRGRRKRYLSYLKAFYAYLEREERIYVNPTLAMAIPREKRSIIKDVLTIDEIEELLKVCPIDTVKGMRDRAIIELLYSSGVRADELCNILIEDIDLHELTLFIRKGKGASERFIPFGQSAAVWIRTYIEKSRTHLRSSSEYLFLSMRGKKLNPQAVCLMVKQYANLAGIEKHVTTHTLRHTCATHMLKGKADIRYVQKQLGHRRISTTERYLRVEISDLKEVHGRCHPREQDDW